MKKQKRFIRFPGSTLSLYNGLQNMIKTTKVDSIIISKIEDGALQVTQEDISFLKRNNNNSTHPVSRLVNSIALFTKAALFYDNIPIVYTFGDEDTDWTSAFVSKEVLYINLPLVESEEFDPDSDIIDYMFQNIPAEAGLKEFISSEFKLSVYRYHHNNNRNAMLEFFKLIDVTAPKDLISTLSYMSKQAFNLYLYQKNVKSKDRKSAQRFTVEDIKLEEENCEQDYENDGGSFS